MNRTLILSAIVLFAGTAKAIGKTLASTGDHDRRTELTWTVGFHNRKEAAPLEWYPADVPGAVQLDYARAHGWGDHNYADNWKDYRWMEDVYWTCRSRFPAPDYNEGERIYFVSKGIDYAFEIRLNGEKIFEQEGMFRAVEIDLTSHLIRRNLLEVLVYPVPKIPGKPDTRDQAAQAVKPAVSYGWDWHPRLIPSGIWDDTYLEVRSAAHFRDVYISYELSDDLQRAEMILQPEGTGIGGKGYAWVLTDPDGETVLRERGKVSGLETRTFSLENPRLWWTHDHGAPALYTSRLQLLDGSGNILDAEEQQIGFRKIRLVMHEGAWSKPDTFPKGRSNPPITIELNGQRIFAKGSNWVNPDIFPGTLTGRRYEGLVDRGLECNFNIFRVWGGGIVNKEEFYDLCDEKGILVWTEFPLACNNYEGTPAYLSVLDKESEAIIRRVRKHPSNAIWSGGNELFNAWSGMTEQSLALRLLNSQCYRLDPETPFIHTSPQTETGMRHGGQLVLQ